MGTELAQKRRLQHRRYTLTDEGIRVSERSALGGRTYVVSYDVLFGERIEIHAVSKEAFWLCLAAIGLAIAFAIGAATGAKDVHWIMGPLAALIAIPFGIWFKISRGDLSWFKEGSSSFWLVRDQPSLEAVDGFLEEAKMKAREKVRAHLLPLLRSNNEYADREHAMLLRDKGIITEREYEDYVRVRQRDDQVN